MSRMLRIYIFILLGTACGACAKSQVVAEDDGGDTSVDGGDTGDAGSDSGTDSDTATGGATGTDTDSLVSTSDSSTGSDTVEPTDTDSDSASEKESDTYIGKETDSDKPKETDTGPWQDTQSDSETLTDAVDTATETDSKTDTPSDTGSISDTYSDTDTNTDVNTDTDIDTDTDIETDAYTDGTCHLPAPDATPIKVYFEIDGNAADAGDFYRLPFPNDIRRLSGRIDLTGHPVPVSLFGTDDPVAEFLDMVENDLDGFGTQSAIYFRFNRPPDSDTLVIHQEPAKQSVFLINLDPNADTYGEHVSYELRIDNTGGSDYICDNWVGIYPSDGRPLLPGTPYAAILTTAIEDEAGIPVRADADFEAMLTPTPPSDTARVSAWNVYKPLRDFLNDDAAVAKINAVPETGLSRGTIAAAAVFTTGYPTQHVPKIREAVTVDADPEVSSLQKNASNPLYTLYTGTVTVPFYQTGTRPFLTASDGGYIEYDALGLPELVEIEPVKFAFSIPKGDIPTDGWPVIIFAHGTDGSERSFIEDGLAERMAGIGVAVLGMEQVQHGNRRVPLGETAGPTTPTPDQLFYNFLNPRAARDNNLQSAADLFQAVRLVAAFDEQSGVDTGLDPSRIYFFGHFQGTQGSFLGAAYEPAMKGIVLSGAGGLLIESLLNKKEPEDVSALLELVLNESSVDRMHPILNLVQAALDCVDPVSYADTVFQQDMTALDIDPRSVLMTSGIDDNYVPETTQFALAAALGVKQWAPAGVPLFDTAVIPEIETLPYQGDGITAVVVRYQPDGYDGHFVMFDNPDLIIQADELIRTMSAPAFSAPILIDPLL